MMCHPILFVNWTQKQSLHDLVSFQHGCYTCLHKYHSVDAWKKFAKEHPEALPYAACSAGTATGDFERLDEVLNAIPEIKER